MKKAYQELEIMVVALLQGDVVRTSVFNNACDDLTEWDDAWDGWFE